MFKSANNNKSFPTNLLTTIIKFLKSKYDYIIIDTKPSVDPLLINALMATDKVIIPLSLTANGIGGLENTISLMEMCKQSNNNLSLAAVIPFNINKKNKIQQEYYQQLQKAFDIGGTHELHVGKLLSLESSISATLTAEKNWLKKGYQ